MKKGSSYSGNYSGSIDVGKILDQELKNLREFKKFAPESIIYRAKNFEKYCKLIDNILCGLVDHTNVLLCFRQMLVAKDPFIANFPQRAIETLSAFLQDYNLDYGSSNSTVQPTRLDVPFPEISMAMVHVVEHIVANNLKSHVFKYRNKLSSIEIEIIDKMKRLRKICFNRINEYTNQIYFSTEYFRNLLFANENYETRIKELQFGLRLSAINFENAKINHEKKLKLFLYKEMIAEDAYDTKLHEKRCGITPQITKLTKTLNEDRITREQTLESVKNLYESTVQKDQKKCKQFVDTRYKREVAVLTMIEKYDRDYSGEYKRLEQLIEKYNQLTEKSRKLDENLSALIEKNLFIHAAIEAERQQFIERRNNRLATLIQRWWRGILKARLRGLSVNLKSRQRSTQRSRKETMLSDGGTRPRRSTRKSGRKVSLNTGELSSFQSETQTDLERSNSNSTFSEDETNSMHTKKLQPEINVEKFTSPTELPVKKGKGSKGKPKKNKLRKV